MINMSLFFCISLILTGIALGSITLCKLLKGQIINTVYTEPLRMSNITFLWWRRRWWWWCWFWVFFFGTGASTTFLLISVLVFPITGFSMLVTTLVDTDDLRGGLVLTLLICGLGGFAAIDAHETPDEGLASRCWSRCRSYWL